VGGRDEAERDAGPAQAARGGEARACGGSGSGSSDRDRDRACDSPGSGTVDGNRDRACGGSRSGSSDGDRDRACDSPGSGTVDGDRDPARGGSCDRDRARSQRLGACGGGCAEVRAGDSGDRGELARARRGRPDVRDRERAGGAVSRSERRVGRKPVVRSAERGSDDSRSRARGSEVERGGSVGSRSGDGQWDRQPRTSGAGAARSGARRRRIGHAPAARQDGGGRLVSDELVFGLFALVVVAFPALRVVTSRDLVRAVLWLAVTLLGTAVLYALLHAPFLAGVQVLTYVGGVVTLMIFGVMVTRKHEGSTVTIDGSLRVRSAIAALAFFGVVAYGILKTDLSSLTPVETPSTQDLAHSLLDRYLLAFEVASVLLLAAIVSAVVLARRRDPVPEAAAQPQTPALREGSAP
jgi:NADH-quinone oxidoreductase subunit J